MGQAQRFRGQFLKCFVVKWLHCAGEFRWIFQFAYKSNGDSSSTAGEKFDFYEEREERLKTINLLLNWMEDDNWWSFAVSIRNDLLLHLESWWIWQDF